MTQDSSTRFRETKRSLPIALLRARETIMAPIRDMLSESGINEQRWRVLRVLKEGGPMEQKAIAAEACLLLPSLTRILQHMEQDGWVSRANDPQDRRRTIGTATETGANLIEAHADQSNAILKRLEQQYGRDKLDDLLDLLEDLRQVELYPVLIERKRATFLKISEPGQTDANPASSADRI
jgi:homoprotocatechuate degradation regulator HpaR